MVALFKILCNHFLHPLLSLFIHLYACGWEWYAKGPDINNRDNGNVLSIISGGGNPWLHGVGGVSFRVLPFLSVGVEGGYRHYFGLYSDTAITLGTTLHFSAIELPERTKRKEKPETEPRPEPLEGDGLVLPRLEFTSIFPVFYSYYDDNPVGTATLYNFEKDEAEDIKLTFYVKQYMDNPKEAPVPERLGPGEQAEVDIYGLFTSEILDVTEGEKVSARINLSYKTGGEELEKEFVETITINNRNALTWDDDRKVLFPARRNFRF